jgi:CheY-like chemotaxis protein
MKKELNCIMLIDDDPSDNFFHEREIKKADLSTTVIKTDSAIKALEYLKSMKENRLTQPDLIFLDINMPKMDGWEFLLEFSQLDKVIQSEVMIMILTTSNNTTDKFRAKAWSFVSGYLTKPLTKEIITDIHKTYFKQKDL